MSYEIDKDFPGYSVKWTLNFSDISNAPYNVRHFKKEEDAVKFAISLKKRHKDRYVVDVFRVERLLVDELNNSQ